MGFPKTMKIMTFSDVVKKIEEVGPVRAYSHPPLPGTIFDGPHEGETVEEALHRREDERFGLNGLIMRHLPTGKRFACSGSKWNKDSRLELFVHRGGDPGYLPEIVPSWKCTLLEAWPFDPRTPCKMKPYGMNGRVYFLHDDRSEAVKIGWASDVSKRRKLLQTGNPNPLVILGSIPGGRGIEAQIHDHFRPVHLRAEWFRATDEVLVQIDSILQDGWPIP